MEGVWSEFYSLKLLLADSDSFGIFAGIEAALDFQPALGRCRRNQFHNYLVTRQRPATPVLRDEGEQPVFNLVPFAGTGRKVTHRDFQPRLIGELLQLQFPQTYA